MKKDTTHSLLPSKKFTTTILSIIGLLVIILGISFLFKKGSVVTNQKKNGAAPIIVKEVVQNDTDQDGLKDWEEALWGLDPLKNDTDGNGINDAQEVANNRDVLSKKYDDAQGITGETPTTRTDQFAREMLTLVSALNESGNLTDENRSAIVENIGDYIQKGDQSKKYTVQELTSISDSSKNHTTYYSALTSTLEKSGVSPEDFASITEFDSRSEAGDLGIYQATARKYEKMIGILAKIPVPEKFLYNHTQLLNRFEAMKDIFAGLGAYEEDPLRALFSFSQFDATLEYFSGITQHFEQIKNNLII